MFGFDGQAGSVAVICKVVAVHIKVWAVVILAVLLLTGSQIPV